MKITLRIFLLVTIFLMLFGLNLSTFAVTITDSNWQEKIADDLFEIADQKDGKYSVAIWLNDIDQTKINDAVFKQTGYRVEQYEDNKRYHAEIAPAIKQSVVTQMSGLAVSNLITTEEIAKQQEKALSDDYNAYIAAKRGIMKGLYSQVTADFVEKNISKTDRVQFQGTYFPLVILYATQNEIEAFSKNAAVKTVYPFVNVQEECRSSIEEQQIGSDSWDGTKSTAYDLGGYWGDGVKIGIIEAASGRFDPTLPQFASIVGDDPDNPGNKKLFYIQNDYVYISPILPEYNLPAITPQITNHASMVTSLIVGSSVTENGTTYMGVVPNATVYQISTLNSYYTIRAMEMLISYNVSVINYSGGQNSLNGEYDSYDAAIDNMMTTHYNVSYVNAAGNNSGNIVSPAKAYNIITVGNAATKSNRQTPLTAPYSINATSCYAEGDYLTNKPDIVAPGTKMYFPNVPLEDNQDSGTSYSAPLVAGVVAQLHQANQTLKTNAVATKAVLLAGADHTVMSKSNDTLVNADACSYIWDKCGVGMVNARNSVDIALANNFTAISGSIANLSDGGQDSLGSIVGQNDVKIRVVLVYDNVSDGNGINSGYGNNIDLHLKCAGSTYASSTMLYNNVEVIEYTFACFDVYDFYAVYTAIDETLSSKTMNVAIAWDMSVVA